MRRLAAGSAWISAIMVALWVPCAAHAQAGGGRQQPPSTPPSIQQQQPGPIGQPDAAKSAGAVEESVPEQLGSVRNADRQKQLVEDTDRLVALATELKADVDRTNKDMLSVDVVRKADEIEKLARSVKQKMKGS